MIALLAFISQSFAVVNIPCAVTDMNNHTTSAVMPEEMVMGSTMAHASYVQPSDSDSDCCNQKQCSQANCISSSVAVVGTDLSLPVLYSQAHTTDYAVSFFTQQVSSLFRPPISR